jgi:hypothetical protein
MMCHYSPHVHKPHHAAHLHAHLTSIYLSIDQCIYLYVWLQTAPKKKLYANQTIQPFNDLNHPILHQHGNLKPPKMVITIVIPSGKLT